MKNTWRKGTLTVTALDYPDPDIIRVEDNLYGKHDHAFYARV